MKPHLDESLAPNGRTVQENFTHWFGPSQVVEEDGHPLVVFHGTNASQPIDRFEGLENVGWFSQCPRLAAKYASTYTDFSGAVYGAQDAAIYPVFLRIAKPLVLDFDMNDSAEAALAVAKAMGITLTGGYDAHEVINDSRFMDAVRAAGFDGVRVKEDGAWTWAALDAWQIKSAVGNSGEFNPTSGDLTDRPADQPADQPAGARLGQANNRRRMRP